MVYLFGNIFYMRGGKFGTFTRFEVGSGYWVRFWLDLWFRSVNLKEAFLALV